MRMTRSIALVIGAVVLLSAACSDGKSLEDAMKNITDEQLAIMVLPQEELGEDAADLPVDPSAGAGFIDADTAAQESPDPKDSAADLEAAGRVSGYELSYADYSGAHAVLELDSGVELFKTESDAAAALDKFLGDFKASEGQDAGGYHHEDIAVSDEKDIGDDASLITAHFVITDPPDAGGGYTSGVVFRIGRLLAFVGENRSDDADTRGNVRELAHRMEKRIRAVLLGDIKETPVPIPSEEETAAIQIQGVLDQIAGAFNGKDIDGYIGFWTDKGLQEAFGVSRDEALQFLNESIGEPPIGFENVSSVELTDNGATFEVDFVDGTVVKHSRLSIIDEGQGPQIDGVEYLETPIPPGATAVDLTLREFAFDFDAHAIESGDIAFEVKNAGQQPHEAVLVKVPEGADIAAAYEQAFESETEPPGFETIAYGGPFDPGATSSLVFAEALAPGRYALVCFFPDTDDPEETPHAFKGMIGEFTVK